jgi:hypothetical protein
MRLSPGAAAFRRPPMLPLGRTAQCVNHTGKFDQQAITRRFDDAAPVLDDLRVDNLRPDRSQTVEGAFLINPQSAANSPPHQPQGSPRDDDSRSFLGEADAAQTGIQGRFNQPQITGIGAPRHLGTPLRERIDLWFEPYREAGLLSVDCLKASHMSVHVV